MDRPLLRPLYVYMYTNIPYLMHVPVNHANHILPNLVHTLTSIKTSFKKILKLWNFKNSKSSIFFIIYLLFFSFILKIKCYRTITLSICFFFLCKRKILPSYRKRRKRIQMLWLTSQNNLYIPHDRQNILFLPVFPLPIRRSAKCNPPVTYSVTLWQLVDRWRNTSYTGWFKKNFFFFFRITTQTENLLYLYLTDFSFTSW